MNDSWINTYEGSWRDSEGYTLVIRIVDDENAIVDFLKNGVPIARPWLQNVPCTKLKASYEPMEGPELRIDLGYDGYTYSVSPIDEDGTLSSCISHYEKDEDLDQYFGVLGQLGYFSKIEAEQGN